MNKQNSTKKIDSGKTPFYIVPTPIGNLEDMSLRAIRILSEVDLILCEDTRVTKKLLSHYEIATPTMSYHAQSSLQKQEMILQKIREGVVFALVSDAGTPTISDPGVKIIHEIQNNLEDEVELIALPGPTALSTALSTSGFMGNQFTFYGFIPQKKGRKQLLDQILEQKQIAIFYESSHRIKKLFAYLDETYPECTRVVYLARELTKLYEEKKRGSIHEILLFLEEHPEKIKGEFVVIFDKE